MIAGGSFHGRPRGRSLGTGPPGQGRSPREAQASARQVPHDGNQDARHRDQLTHSSRRRSFSARGRSRDGRLLRRCTSNEQLDVAADTEPSRMPTSSRRRVLPSGSRSPRSPRYTSTIAWDEDASVYGRRVDVRTNHDVRAVTVRSTFVIETSSGCGYDTVDLDAREHRSSVDRWPERRAPDSSRSPRRATDGSDSDRGRAASSTSSRSARRPPSRHSRTFPTSRPRLPVRRGAGRTPVVTGGCGGGALLPRQLRDARARWRFSSRRRSACTWASRPASGIVRTAGLRAGRSVYGSVSAEQSTCSSSGPGRAG